MTFKEQATLTLRAGIRMFGAGVLLLVLSRVKDVFNNGLILGVAEGLFFLGLFLMIGAASRSSAKRSQLRFEKNGMTHPLAALSSAYRWYYWVDKNGKDRDA